MEHLLSTETLIIELLLIVAVVAIVVQRLRIPYTVALVIVGLLITFQETIRFELTPELILALFVPPLVFEAAFHIEVRRLRDSWVQLLVLAVPGVVLTTILVGFIVAKGMDMPLATALVFGALMAATDPVAVVALFRALGAPKQLSVIVEGESLFNDGTSIVIFKLMLIAAMPAVASAAGESESFDIFASIVDFVRVAAGGILIGISLGWLTSKAISYLDDYLIETTLTTVVAFGAYLVAEKLGVSGVLAVVSAGIICGNVGPRGMSPTTRIMLFNFWEYLAFIVNSLVFLLIGLDVNISQLIETLGPIGIGIGAVVLGRVIVVYGLTWLTNFTSKKIPMTFQHVLVWGGLRGAISLALALSLPTNFPQRDTLRVMTFGVVLFTLMVQGTSMQWLLRKLGLIQRADVQLEYERKRGRVVAARAARERLHKLHEEGSISAATWKKLSKDLDDDLKEQVDAQHALLKDTPNLQEDELTDAAKEGLRAKRAALSKLLSDGVISYKVYHELVTEIDAEIQGQDPEKESKE